MKVYRTKREAEEALAKFRIDHRQLSRPAVDPFVTLAAYVSRFLADCMEQEVTPATLERYEHTREKHILPALGRKKLRDITPGDVRTFLLSKRQEDSNLQGQKGADRTPRASLSKNTVHQFRSVLSSVLSLAVEDEVLGSDPALGVFRRRRTKAEKERTRARVGETVKAMDREQRNRFLAVAAERHPEVHPAFVLMGPRRAPDPRP